ncbi:protein EXORDIUM-like 2 [Lotus japonicus]|uniref:protein EXORDIUM-like 2 n=1 Tax=Lotus japonicus TaxID=34305 RepID=UPI00258B31B3|nr:protein EXORDIUM-like 2 [Lotus japonicus]
MAPLTHSFFLLLILLLSCKPNTSQAKFRSPNRKLALVQEQPLVLKYHKGPLLNGNITLHLIWYGTFTPKQRSILLDFIQSLSATRHTPSPSVSSWWKTTERYRGGPRTLTVADQTLHRSYSLGKSLKMNHLLKLASKAKSHAPSARGGHAIHVILTSADVAVEDFCMNQCGTHDSGGAGRKRVAYAWVGNPVTQCPGQCAWPFHKPIYGPQSPPLVSPNGDIGVDGMVINLATVLAGTVTNPFDNGYFQGPATAPLEAVSACTGIFGKGAYPGYPGNVLVDKATGASYNAVGVRGRKFLLPAMWDPVSSTCKSLV